MLVELHTMRDYQNYLAAAGLQVTRSNILNPHSAKTWDFCLDIIKDKAHWQTSSAFSAASKPCARASRPTTSPYGLIVAHKPTLSY
jgi:hypothetical protein